MLNPQTSPALLRVRHILLAALFPVIAAGASAQSLSDTQNFDGLSNGNLLAAGWSVVDPAVNISFRPGASSGDKFLEFLAGSEASYSFMLGAGYQYDLTISFSQVGWASTNGSAAATVTVSNPSGLLDTQSLLPQYVGAASENDYQGTNPPDSPSGTYSSSFSAVGGGLYVLDISTLGTNSRKLRIDDLSIDAIAQPVPEPDSWLLIGAGLAVLGALTQRRSASSGV